ncbi:hypothetical protein GH714_016490 [Hevea brasiliensis]|uniref:Uncharacterized protein n=1 Tax=Hevea brasiliensis TaxID=3981 RepID=A0A6A6LT46_HEVBR|nr:hypothetical protein GH714_016490 [Hevea brasiliensis]
MVSDIDKEIDKDEGGKLISAYGLMGQVWWLAGQLLLGCGLDPKLYDLFWATRFLELIWVEMLIGPTKPTSFGSLRYCYVVLRASNQVHNKMATHLQNEISMDVAADSNSCESLSFSGFLSVQDLGLKSPQTDGIIQIRKQNQGFEFSHIADSAAQTLNKNCPADISISGGQLQLQAFLYQSKQVNHKPGSKGATRCNNERLNRKVSDNPNHKDRNQAKMKHTPASNLSFGQKIFQSFVSPCRECHAHKPSIKAHTAPKETVKTH